MKIVSEKNPRTKSISIIMVLVVSALVVSIIFTGKIDQIGNFLRSIGWIGIFLCILLFGVLGASPIPSEPFTVLIASIFGPLQGAVITTFGNFLAALVEFYIGKNLGDIVAIETKRAQLPLGLNKLPVNSPIFLIAGKMLPSFGPKFISVISGMAQVSLWRYIWTTLVSTFIGAIIIAYGGYGLLSLKWFK